MTFHFLESHQWLLVYLPQDEVWQIKPGQVTPKIIILAFVAYPLSAQHEEERAGWEKQI